MEAVVRFRKEMFRRGAPPHHVFFIPAEEDGAVIYFSIWKFIFLFETPHLVFFIPAEKDGAR